MMAQRRRLIPLALLAGAVTAGGWWWTTREDPPAPGIADTGDDNADRGGVDGHTAATGGPDQMATRIVIGEYRPDTSGLPPKEAPLATQIPQLRSAAARGNATAACRLAVIGFQCGTARAFRWADMPPPSEAFVRETEENLRRQYGDVSLDALPERYRAHAQRQLDTKAMVAVDGFAGWRAMGQRCADAPLVSTGETLDVLRQAALAGEPNSMVRYASGLWIVDSITSSLARGFTQSGPGMDWLRSPGFDRWRREAAAVRRAGLERGDPEMLYFEASSTMADELRMLEPPDPVTHAAALRAYAALIGGHSPESTLALGLPAEQASKADRLADEWAARGRERGRRVDDVVDRLLAHGGSACD